MIASAMNNKLEWDVHLYQRNYPKDAFKQQQFSMKASIPDALCDKTEECKVKIKIGDQEFMTSSSSKTAI